MAAGRDTQGAVSLVQVALNTGNLSGTLRLFSDLFGFRNAGGSAAWGKVLAMQALPEDAHCVVWWMIGATSFFQVEIFAHGHPEPRPLPDDWRPCDHGWVRMGIAVGDFDRVLSGLDRMGIALLGSSGAAPVRRLAFREPYVGSVIEVIERVDEPGPTVVYATSSVADLEAARRFYADVVQAEIAPLDLLHEPDDEALWGLAGAEREGFLACLPHGVLEIVQYASPPGCPRRADHRSSDHGMLNVAVGSRSHDAIRALIARVRAFGLEPTDVVDTEQLCGTYVVEPGYELEMLAIPPELDAYLGFAPSIPFVNDVGE